MHYRFINSIVLLIHVHPLIHLTSMIIIIAHRWHTTLVALVVLTQSDPHH
jgi:hypothetical protein